MNKGLIIIIIVCVLILVGCQRVIQPLANISEEIGGKVEAEKQKQAEKIQAMIKCQELCQQQLSSDGQNFDNGPCLSNEIIPDWVCDVAHSPRQEVDNDPANQCPAFRQGKAHHFVEVDGNCNVIKVY